MHGIFPVFLWQRMSELWIALNYVHVFCLYFRWCSWQLLNVGWFKTYVSLLYKHKQRRFHLWWSNLVLFDRPTEWLSLGKSNGIDHVVICFFFRIICVQWLGMFCEFSFPGMSSCIWKPHLYRGLRSKLSQTHLLELVYLLLQTYGTHSHCLRQVVLCLCFTFSNLMANDSPQEWPTGIQHI